MAKFNLIYLPHLSSCYKLCHYKNNSHTIPPSLSSLNSALGMEMTGIRTRTGHQSSCSLWIVCARWWSSSLMHSNSRRICSSLSWITCIPVFSGLSFITGKRWWLFFSLIFHLFPSPPPFHCSLLSSLHSFSSFHLFLLLAACINFLPICLLYSPLFFPPTARESEWKRKSRPRRCRYGHSSSAILRTSRIPFITPPPATTFSSPSLQCATCAYGISTTAAGTLPCAHRY